MVTQYFITGRSSDSSIITVFRLPGILLPGLAAADKPPSSDMTLFCSVVYADHPKVRPNYRIKQKRGNTAPLSQRRDRSGLSPDSLFTGANKISSPDTCNTLFHLQNILTQTLLKYKRIITSGNVQISIISYKYMLPFLPTLVRMPTWYKMFSTVCARETLM